MMDAATQVPMMPTGAAQPPQWRDAPTLAILLLAMTALYLALHVGCWMPGTDAQYYIDIARSVALGRGYQINGGPAKLVPPLWPMVLGGAMRLSSSYAYLHLLPTALALLAVANWYRVLRRFAPPGRAALVVATAGMLWWGYYSATALISEALFMALFSSALVLAVALAQGRWAWWRLVMLALLCGAMVLTRFTGLIAWLLVGAVLLSGPISPRQRLLGVLVSGAVTVGVFAATQSYLLPRLLPSTIQNPAPWVADSASAETDESLSVVPTEKAALGLRLLSAGRWLSGLLWMPTELGVASGALAQAVNLVGWLLIALLGVAVWRGTQNRQWIWLAVLLYCGLLCARWRAPNARYLLPVAPMLILAIWKGIESLLSPATARTLVGLWLGSVLLCNVALYAVDLYIARAGDYYANYYAGHGQDLVAMSHYLRSAELRDGQLAVSARYRNLNRSRKNGFGLRAMRVLCDRLVRQVPSSVCDGPPNAALAQWAAKAQVRYYLYRPPASPWRVWHFRMPGVQKLLTGQQQVVPSPFWVLYELRGREFVEVAVPPVAWGPRGVF